MVKGAEGLVGGAAPGEEERLTRGSGMEGFWRGPPALICPLAEDTMGQLMVVNGVNFPEDRIADFCRRHGVQKLSLFGSILRHPTPEGGYGFRPTSDVDVLVEFFPGKTPSLLDFAGMQLEMSEFIGREVQLHTPPMLSRYFRHEVLKEARMVHAA